MAGFDQDLINLIDQRIRLNAARTRAVGTCVTRATTGPAADVVFDGSTQAMPVKVLGSVVLRAGDRCVLDRYGTEWIVTGSFVSSAFGEASWQGPPSSQTSTLTSGTFVDIQEIPPLTFDKAFDNTYVRMDMEASAFALTSANTGVRWGLRWTPVVTSKPYTASVYSMNSQFFNATSVHETCHYNARPIDIPAGRYEVQACWRRTSGSGGLTSDNADMYTIELDEAVRASTPVL